MQEDRGLTKDPLQGWSLARKPHQEDDGLIQGTFEEEGQELTMPLPGENLVPSLVTY